MPTQPVSEPSSAPASIHNSYNDCLEKTRQFLAATGYPDHVSQAVQTGLEVMGRLKTWGDESKAEMFATSRGSLDDVLRKDVKMHEMVVRILSRMCKQLALCESTSRSGMLL